MFHRIAVSDVEYAGGPARIIEAHMGSHPFGERVVVTHWIAKAVGQVVEYPAGTITYKRVSGNGRITGSRGLKVVEPERVVTKEELPPEMAERL